MATRKGRGRQDFEGISILTLHRCDRETVCESGAICLPIRRKQQEIDTTRKQYRARRTQTSRESVWTSSRGSTNNKGKLTSELQIHDMMFLLKRTRLMARATAHVKVQRSGETRNHEHDLIRCLICATNTEINHFGEERERQTRSTARQRTQKTGRLDM